MCFSTSLRKDAETVQERFRAELQYPLEYTPYYHLNGFTHGNLYIVPMECPDEIFPAMWGLVSPFGTDDPDGFLKKYNTLNAKSETVFSSNTFRHSIHDKRCLVLADGFHEPHHHNNVSYPYFCHYPDDAPFAFAGLYSELDNARKRAVRVHTQPEETAALGSGRTVGRRLALPELSRLRQIYLLLSKDLYRVQGEPDKETL